MRVTARVDGSPDLGNPELDAEMREHRVGQAELVAIKRSRGLTNHYGVKTTVGIAKRGK